VLFFVAKSFEEKRLLTQEVVYSSKEASIFEVAWWYI
jgi:hypothetical protein